MTPEAVWSYAIFCQRRMRIPPTWEAQFRMDHGMIFFWEPEPGLRSLGFSVPRDWKATED